MQVCTSLQTDNHASTPPLSFYRPHAQPTASKHEGKTKQNNGGSLITLSLCDCDEGDTTGERGDSMLACRPSRWLVGSISHSACCFQLDLSPLSGTRELSDPATASLTFRGVGVNLIWGNGFRDLGPSNGGACVAPPCTACSREGRPLPLRGSRGVTPGNFF